jgi:hypothetical protein
MIVMFESPYYVKLSQYHTAVDVKTKQIIKHRKMVN